MIGLVVGLIQGVLGFLNSVLPTSPFQGMLTGLDSLQLGLGWLNWVVPVGDMALIFGLWLTALLAWAAVDWAMSSAVRLTGSAVAA